MTEPTGSPEDLLPLNPPMYRILLSLARGERHGYAMMQDARESTDGTVKLSPGTLYYSLQRMVERGLIEEAGERSGADENERRIYYRITGFGRRVAEAESRRLAALVDLARARRFLEDRG